jgi:hypothetical protein
MHKNLPNDNDSDAPFNDFDMKLNVTHLISNARHSKEASLIEIIELKPTEQQRIPLGTFKEDNPPTAHSLKFMSDGQR